MNYAQQLPKRARKVRLDLAGTGSISLRDEDVKPSTPIEVALSKEAVCSSDEYMHYKTTRRGVYERALSAHPEAQDVLLCVNGNRKLTHFAQDRKFKADPPLGLTVDLRRELLSNNAGPSFLFQAIAVASDLDDVSMM